MRNYDNWLNSYRRFTRKNEAPDHFHLWSGLWALSTAIERKAWLNFGYFTIYPNLYIVLTGPPASRKTTAAKIAKELILDPAEITDETPDVTTKEALIQYMGQENKVFTYRGEDYNHCSTSILSSEWSTLLGDKDTEFCNTLCKLYDCDNTFNKFTKGQGRDKLKNVFLTMLGCSTSRQISDALPQASIGGGFTSRVIFVLGDEVKSKRNPRPELSDEDRKIQEKLVQDIMNIRERISGPFNFTIGGGKFFDDWYINRNDLLRADDKFIHYCDRRPIHVLKIAMLLSANKDNDMMIGAGEISEAIRILENIEPRMPEALGGVGLSRSAPIIQRVSELLRQHGSLTKREIQSRVWKDANKEELQMALETMELWGAIKNEKLRYVWKGDRYGKTSKIV